MKERKIMKAIFLLLFITSASILYAQETHRAPCLDCDPGGSGGGGGGFSCATNQHFVYVDSSRANDSGNGYSWATAKKTLGAAIYIANRCNDIQQIKVAKGTYYPGPSGTGDPRDATFFIRNSYTISGGYNPATDSYGGAGYRTILDGNKAGSRVYHVITVYSASSVGLTDLHIRNGLADGAGTVSLDDDLGINMDQDDGAAIWARAVAKIDIYRCIFTGNQAYNNGGAIYGNLAEFNIYSSVFYTNIAQYGAAFFATVSGFQFRTQDIINCTFAANASGTGGGTLLSAFTNTNRIRNCIIWQNSTAFAGSGSTTVYNSIVQDGPGDSTNFNTSPSFADANDADGPDNLWRTDDDGLIPCKGSQAINRGDNAAGLIIPDLRNNPRIFNQQVDIGAYELQLIPTPLSGLSLPNTNSVTNIYSGETTAPTLPCLFSASLTPYGPDSLTGPVTVMYRYSATLNTVYGNIPVVSRNTIVTFTNNPAGATYKIKLFFTTQDFSDFNNRSDTYYNLPVSSISPRSYLRVVASLPDGPVLINPADYDIVEYSPSFWYVQFNTYGSAAYYITAADKYIFTGIGNWSDPTKWQNNNKPHNSINQHTEIIIAPGAVCNIDLPVRISKDAKLTVQTGAELKMNGNFFLE